MADDRHDETAEETGPPAGELADFAVEPDARLAGRVQRSINRHLLVADTLELSFDVFVRTAWTYLRTLIEAIPGKTDGTADSAKEKRDE